MQNIRPPYAYQSEGSQWAAARKFGLLADDPGLGKSRQLLDAARIKGVRRLLIICPKSVMPSWLFQCAQWWSDGPKAKIITSLDAAQSFSHHNNVICIVNYDRLSRDDSWANAFVSGKRWDMVIADEGHALKDVTSFRTRRFYKIVFPHCDSFFMATATPMPNNYSEIYPLLRFAHPDAIMKDGAPLTRFNFEDEFCIIKMRHVGRGRPVRTIVGSQKGNELRERIGDFMLRRKKKDVLKDLPPRRVELLPLYPSKDAFAQLQELDALVPADASDEDVIRILQSDHEHFATLMRALGMAKAGAAVQWVFDFMDGNKDKLVMWAVHHQVIDHCVSALSDFNPVKIDGRVSLADREKAIERFLNDDNCRIMVGQIKACGTGVTLLSEKTQPADCLFVETTYSPADTIQSIDRIHRIGQTNPVLARIVVADKVALDRRVQNILTEKARAISEVM